MAQQKYKVEKASQVLGYTIANADKFNRAVYGTALQEGQLVGGVGEDATDEAKLAEYDRLGGLILKDGRKVQIGSFYDFKKKTARVKPQVKLEFRGLDGELVTIDEGQAIPVEVQAAEKLEEKKTVAAEAKVSKTSKKSSKKTEDDEDEE